MGFYPSPPGGGLFIEYNMFPEVPKSEIISLDYETTGLRYWDPDFRVFGIAVSAGDNSWYWDIRDAPNVVEWLRQTIRGRMVIAQNAQYEYQCSRVLGADPRLTNWYCTMVAECLIDEHHLTYDLASIAKSRNVDSQKTQILEEIRASMGWRDSREVLSRLSEVPSAMVARYGASDASDALSIYHAQQIEIAKQDLHRVLDLEMRLLPVLADMSWTGVRVDLEAARAAIPLLDIKQEALQDEIQIITGGEFNVNSSPQVRAFFKPEPISKFQWRLIDGTLVGPTKGGKGPSLDQNVMREIKHPLAEKILALRKTIKLRDTFIRGHVIGSADGDGYVHTQFNQTRNDADAGTVTGRLSSTDPALQQITKRDKANAAILRAMFLPDAGDEWLCADYSQVDFRCAAHLINDQSVIDMYELDPSLDYHQIVSDMTGIPRNATYAGAPNTKQINLGLAFGAGPGKLAFMMGMPYDIKESRGKMQYVPGQSATDVFNLYHKKLPGVKEFMKKAEAVAKETGYVRTAIGRRLRFPVGAHKAAGLLYQSYAADLHKIGLVEVDTLIRSERLPARLLMSCHDEIGVSMKQDEMVKNQIVEHYTNFNGEDSVVRMRVPITASGDFGHNWYEASK
ncbi:PolA DNA polymerase I - 3'-5' exonuclease and polymerase domains [uncultured Caudovirales phage]|uniref:PolA DNA polymerase I - 3'-5' exonuclease and polymerase domains n=1 Tax=uncultured Caudovirales phage TaxID=2100421 RepID=A0A6J7XEM4_9CAUD|nr:PolA DNA polymerase I - 3'-5' exonuclease and polymerase domains [uncultured Caudovirales phage]